MSVQNERERERERVCEIVCEKDGEKMCVMERATESVKSRCLRI